MSDPLETSAPPVSVEGTRAALVDALQAGWLAADQPLAPGEYTPSLVWNSSGGVNTVTRVGVGSYVVSMPGLGANDGNVQVAAYGPSSAHCKIKQLWSVQNGALTFPVVCFNSVHADAQPVDEPFIATFQYAPSAIPQPHYAVAPEQRTLVPGESTFFYATHSHAFLQFEAGGNDFILPHICNGDVNCVDSLAHVTAIGTAPGYAYVRRQTQYSPFAGAMSVALVEPGRQEPTALRLGVHAHKIYESEPSYGYVAETPLETYWGSAQPVSVTYVSTGEYVVRVPGFAGMANAVPFVTADYHDLGGTLCKSDDQWAEGADKKVRVRCWDDALQPRNAGFIFSYLTSAIDDKEAACASKCLDDQLACEAWGDPQCWCDYNYKGCMAERCDKVVSGPKTCPKPKGPKQPLQQP